MALSPSGSGKGHSTGIIENEVLHQFKDTFTECTFPVISDKHLETLAIKRAHEIIHLWRMSLLKLPVTF